MASTVWGFVACGLASVFFGSMFVPIRALETGDGAFVQWVMAVAIFLVGLIVHLWRAAPRFYPLAMLGGALWATGNITAVPIINQIGMALGILIWTFTNLLFGWASGRYGWFGMKEQKPESELLNTLGLALSCVSTVMFGFVQSRPPPAPEKHGDSEPLLADSSEAGADLGPSEVRPPSPPLPLSGRIVAVVVRDQKRLIAVTAALFAGVFYGLCFAPVIYIQDNVSGASGNGLDYVFAHFTGILATSTFYFVCYAAYRQNRPFANPRTILPGLLTGLMWGIAQSAWFIANDSLSEVVSFPIITRFPGVVAAIWGVFFFHEIRGYKNLQILFWAVVITVMGGILSGLSKVISL